MNRPFTFADRFRSFGYAFQGVWHMLKSQHNAWIHAVATVVVISGGLALGLSPAEWCWIVLAITSVWTAEALNTAFEFLADATTSEHNSLIGHAKDVAAGAVLLTALGALAIGFLVLGPHLLVVS